MMIDTKPYNAMAIQVIWKYPGGGGGGGGGLKKLEMFVTKDLSCSIVAFKGFFSTNQSDNLRGEPAFS